MRRSLLLAVLMIAASFAVCSAGRPTEIPIREIAIGGSIRSLLRSMCAVYTESRMRSHTNPGSVHSRTTKRPFATATVSSSCSMRMTAGRGA